MKIAVTHNVAAEVAQTHTEMTHPDPASLDFSSGAADKLGGWFPSPPGFTDTDQLTWCRPDQLPASGRDSSSL